MRAVIQRTHLPATVKVEEKIVGQIEKGLIVYLGIEPLDNNVDISWLANKIVNMRIFGDDDGKINLSVRDIGGEILLISQFTLFASTKKGNRPSFLKSAKPEFANEMYENFKSHLHSQHNIKVSCGIFGADMKVKYTNDGPITIFIDSKHKE
ncbi:MAG: D-tyrosyl-tRNA(Tyr) deacylase [Saprospiraceae bacterium]|nr:D-tyrosyl-tRNA(Tyr) deacylase [Bacteroidia bacterium]NNE13384.1 D-tyrosyl-tRNA(Tyr) deacylase [Saprospiraceae bacterium]NNL91067.1 D-tyrosyl-tRNA(Tyr) deacylase [Saprospiraceae bacterium]